MADSKFPIFPIIIPIISQVTQKHHVVRSCSLKATFWEARTKSLLTRMQLNSFSYLQLTCSDSIPLIPGLAWPCIKRETRWEGTRNNLTPYLGSWSPELSSDTRWTMSVKALCMLSSHSRCLPEATRANSARISWKTEDILKSNLSPEYSGLASGASWPWENGTPFLLLEPPACSFKKSSLFALLQSLTQDISHFLLYNSSFYLAIWNISLL